MCGMGIITSSEDILISAMSSKQAQVKLQHCVGSLDRFEEFRQGKKEQKNKKLMRKLLMMQMENQYMKQMKIMIKMKKREQGKLIL